MGRIAGSLLVLALVLAAGCSGSKDEGAKVATVQARELPAIYADMLTQRDRIQAAIAKGTNMWHEDTAAVAAGANELDRLYAELRVRVADMSSLGDRMRGLESHLGLSQSLVARLRDTAVQETVGLLPKLMVELDGFLRGLESFFTPEDLGGLSVTTRPGFAPAPGPRPESESESEPPA